METTDEYFHYVRGYKYSFPRASKYCEEKFSTKLAHPDSKKQWEALVMLGRNTTDKTSWWIGLRRDTGNGTFMWNDGRPFLPPDGKPIVNRNFHRCAAIQTFSNTFQIRAYPCQKSDTNLHFVCQKNLPDESVTTTDSSSTTFATSASTENTSAANVFWSTPGFYISVSMPTVLLLLILILVIAKLYCPKKSKRRTSELNSAQTEQSYVPAAPLNSDVDVVEPQYEYMSAEDLNHYVVANNARQFLTTLPGESNSANRFPVLNNPSYSRDIGPSQAYFNEPSGQQACGADKEEGIAESAYHYINENSGLPPFCSDINTVYENAYLN